LRRNAVLRKGRRELYSPREKEERKEGRKKGEGIIPNSIASK